MKLQRCNNSSWLSCLCETNLSCKHSYSLHHCLFNFLYLFFALLIAPPPHTHKLAHTQTHTSVLHLFCLVAVFTGWLCPGRLFFLPFFFFDLLLFRLAAWKFVFVVFFFPFHTAVLKPDFHLSFGQSQSVWYFNPSLSCQVGIEEKLFLEFERLIAAVCLATSPSSGRRTHKKQVGSLIRLPRLTLRSHPREQLCGRRTLFCVVRLVADAPRGELTVAILHKVGVLSTKKCLPLESIISIEVTRLAVTSYCAWTLLVRGCG